MIRLSALLQSHLLHLRIQRRNLHAVVGRHRRLRLELLGQLVDFSQLLRKLSELLLDDLLHANDHLDLLLGVVRDQALALSALHGLVGLRQVEVQQVIAQVLRQAVLKPLEVQHQATRLSERCAACASCWI